MLQLGRDRQKGPLSRKGVPRPGAPRPGAPGKDRRPSCFASAFSPLGRQFRERRAWLGLPPECPQSRSAALPLASRGGGRYPVGTLYKVILTVFLTLCSSSGAFASRWGWRFESVC